MPTHVEVKGKPSTLEGNQEYALLYAQRIVRHFTESLEQNNCLISIPIGVYMELDRHEKAVTDLVDTAIQVYNPNIYDGSAGGDKDEARASSIADRDDIARAAMSQLSEDCFNCNMDFPKFDFSGVFGTVLADARIAIDGYQDMFKFNKASVCQYAFFLSYLCIPDLLKLIAMILAAIVRLLSGIKLPRITIIFMIMALLSAIIGALLSALSMLIRFAMTPILCILDTIESIIDDLPTPENLRKVSKSDMEALGMGHIIDGRYDTGLKEQVQAIRERITSAGRGLESNISKVTKDTFGALEGVIQKSIDSLNESVTELMGLFTHFACEPGRSGLSIGQWLGTASELVAMLNLLRYVVKGKAGKAALKAACNRPRGSRVTPDDKQAWMDSIAASDEPLDVSTIAEIIKDTIGSEVDIVVDGDTGKPIAAIIKDPDSNNSSNKDGHLTLFNCELDNYIASSDISTILDEAVNEAIERVDTWETGDNDGTGHGQRDPSIHIIPVSEIDTSKYKPGAEWVPLEIDTDWNIADHVKDALDLVNKYNPSKEGTIETPIIVLDPDSIDNYIPPKRHYDKYIYKPVWKDIDDSDWGVNDFIKDDTLPDNQRGDKSLIDTSGNLVDLYKENPSKTISLECGTPEEISKRIGLIYD